MKPRGRISVPTIPAVKRSFVVRSVGTTGGEEEKEVIVFVGILCVRRHDFGGLGYGVVRLRGCEDGEGREGCW